MRNYALNETEVNTMRGALLVVQQNLQTQKQGLDRLISNGPKDVSDAADIYSRHQLIIDHLEKIKAALDALK